MHIKRKNNSGIGAVGLIFLCIIIGLIALTWVKFIDPFFFEQKLGLADFKFEFNKFDVAGEMYKRLLPKAPEKYKQIIRDRLAQLPLAHKYLVELAAKNQSFHFGALDALSAKIGLFYIRFKMTNIGTETIPVRSSLFYLKSTKGKCEVALDRPQNPEVSVIDGELKPGEEMQGGICVKYLMSGNDELYLVYNNGELYINSRIMPSRIFAQTDRDEFKKKPGWKGFIGKKQITGQQKPEESKAEETKQPVASVAAPPATSET
ncbi:MAG: hypothetical protein P9M03_10400, partial [Candidatus Theseobacter exili]|nr:hypothetical protein [Candidatus Theseobacter exili]